MSRALQNVLKVAISLTLILWVFWRVGPGELLHQLSRATPGYVLLALCLFCLSNMVGACQWDLLLRLQGVNLSMKRALKLYFIGLFFNNFLPTNIGGDVYKIYDLSRNSENTGGVVAATTMDRLLGFVALMIMATIALLSMGSRLSVRGIAEVVVGAVVVFSLLFLFLFHRGIARRVGRFPLRFLPSRAKSSLKEVYDGLHLYRVDKRFLGYFLCLSLFIQSLRVMVNFSAALAMGVRVSPLYFFLIIPVIALAIALPISVGGIGVRESTAVLLFGQIGIPEPLAASMQILTYIVTLLTGLAGGFLFMSRAKKSS